MCHGVLPLRSGLHPGARCRPEFASRWCSTSNAPVAGAPGA
ncbi:hypothetical protein C791_4647 [Amycolatopsis azurea DSM 43854]|uniref:Uncharacterized protein n=1 Tax=Amycolatopsis azurea DSM 43854 TaxID=1238180 RepID=M2QHZ6_9PSEU|nr:hypothetical protein C791_4647 [Amycolatopsis azurea DSM 43854]